MGNPTMNFNERGYTLAGALTLIAVFSILMALAIESWTWVKRRDNEAELIFRGKEYAEAIARYQLKYGTYPPDMETLYKLKFIRRLYTDPMTKSGKWKVLHPESLVQLGLAGQINQPGTSGSQGGDEKGKRSKHRKRDDQAPEAEPGGDQQSDSDQQSDEESMEKEGDEEPETETTGLVVGVVSRSKKASIRVYNNQSVYNKWYFTYALAQQQAVPPPPPQTGGGKPLNEENPPVQDDRGDKGDDGDE